MRFLLDTNEFIAAEPATGSDVEVCSQTMATLLRLAAEGGHVCYVHPAALDDLGRDRNKSRRQVREILFEKYAKLPAPPSIPDEWLTELRDRSARDNDRVDLLHLAAVRAFAVNYLVTEDRGIHKRAKRLGLDTRVVTAATALAVIRSLFEVELAPPPAVEAIYAHELSPSEPFFKSLREDYARFDQWFDKIRLEHRTGWAIRERGQLAALCLIKNESANNDAGLSGNVLKISTLKVAPESTGRKYGELLLKAVFLHAARRRKDALYVTVFDRKHPGLVALLEDFGFRLINSTTSQGEAILCKQLRNQPKDGHGLDPLAYHITFGPPALAIDSDQVFVVPIQPRFAERLFPDAAGQVMLPFTPHPYGNALKKAYLCRSSSRKVEPGATLLFYRSSDLKSVIAVGVADAVIVSKDPIEIGSAVGTRTVYSMNEIETMCVQGRDVLAILFRQDRVLSAPISLQELQAHNVLRRHSQSITRATIGDSEWLLDRLDV